LNQRFLSFKEAGGSSSPAPASSKQPGRVSFTPILEGLIYIVIMGLIVFPKLRRPARLILSALPLNS
jgi:hypothetical protein